MGYFSFSILALKGSGLYHLLGNLSSRVWTSLSKSLKQADVSTLFLLTVLGKLESNWVKQKKKKYS